MEKAEITILHNDIITDAHYAEGDRSNLADVKPAYQLNSEQHNCSAILDKFQVWEIREYLIQETNHFMEFRGITGAVCM